MKACILTILSVLSMVSAASASSSLEDTVNHNLLKLDSALRAYVMETEKARNVTCVANYAETMVMGKEVINHPSDADVEFVTEFVCSSVRNPSDIYVIHVEGDIFSEEAIYATKIEGYWTR